VRCTTAARVSPSIGVRVPTGHFASAAGGAAPASIVIWPRVSNRHNRRSPRASSGAFRWSPRRTPPMVEPRGPPVQPSAAASPARRPTGDIRRTRARCGGTPRAACQQIRRRLGDRPWLLLIHHFCGAHCCAFRDHRQPSQRAFASVSPQRKYMGKPLDRRRERLAGPEINTRNGLGRLSRATPGRAGCAS